MASGDVKETISDSEGMKENNDMVVNNLEMRLNMLMVIVEIYTMLKCLIPHFYGNGQYGTFKSLLT